MEARILLVEDDDYLRELLAEALEDEDYTVFQAADAMEAFRVAQSQKLDLVVTDVRLGRIDGLRCLVDIRGIQPNIRSIVITGYASEDAPDRAIEVQAHDYIYKPFELDDLILSVERVLQAPQESERYSSLLSGLVSGYQKLVGVVRAAISSGQLKAVEEIRDKAYRAFYVGIRSKKLNKEWAYEVWVRLDHADAARDKFVSAGLDLQQRKELVDAYTNVLSAVRAYSKTQMPRIGKTEEDERSRSFNHLFRNLLSGRVSVELLKQASYLWRLDELTLSQSEPLTEFNRTVWGAEEASI